MSATKVIQVKGVDPYDITIGRALLGEAHFNASQQSLSLLSELRSAGRP